MSKQSNGSNSTEKALDNVQHIFLEIKDILEINREQSTYAKLFDMLAAIEDVNDLLDEAWKVSELNNISDDNMRREFIEIVDEFGKLKRELKRDYIKQKH